MQENNSATMANSPQTTEVQPVVMSNDPQPKTNSFLVILLSVLLFVSVAISGFFAFQTQKLVKELTVLRTEPTPIANVEPTIEPVATNSASTTTDPTANWKTYTDDEYKFSFKYPKDWELRCVATELPDGWLDRNICDLVSPKAVLDHGQVENGAYFVVGVSKPNPNYANFSEYLTYSSKQYGYVYKDKKINNISGKVALINGKETNYLFEKSGHVINTNWIYSENSETVDQILSTFKFTN